MNALTPPKPPNRTPLVVGAVLIGAVLGYAGVKGTAAITGTPVAASGPCTSAIDVAKRITPLIKGEVAALTPATKPLEVPDVAFNDADGKPRKLSEFRGRTVLLNLWATWCVPCRAEMPALDRLQAQRGSASFEVVAVNIDTRNPEKPKAFLEEAKLTALHFFTDPSARVFQDLKSVGRALGMPTSMLIDAKGCEIATLSGPAEWASDDAIRLIAAATQ